MEYAPKDEKAWTTAPSFGLAVDSVIQLPVQWLSSVALTALLAEEHFEE